MREKASMLFLHDAMKNQSVLTVVILSKIW